MLKFTTKPTLNGPKMPTTNDVRISVLNPISVLNLAFGPKSRRLSKGSQARGVLGGGSFRVVAHIVVIACFVFKGNFKYKNTKELKGVIVMRRSTVRMEEHLKRYVIQWQSWLMSRTGKYFSRESSGARLHFHAHLIRQITE